MSETRVLEHRQALVVVHGEDGIEVLQVPWHEGAVRRQRADQVEPFVAQLFDDRGDRVDFLTAHVAAFTGMRIQAEHGDARLLDGKVPAQVGMQDAQGAGQSFARDRRGHR